MKTIFSAVTVTLLLSGCVASNKPVANSVITSAITPQVTAAQTNASANMVQDSASRLIQCRKELDAMQSYNPPKYQSYKSEFDKTASHLKKYLEVKGGIGNDINELAMPKYQFAIRDVCFRIKTDLATSIVKTV
ncbi:hypothetical protein HX773_21310 [Pantoea sp. B9002]|uniref:hypothetical protein n=1 Tax=Pantoea sp. B9002 TaxID=2726979 RepID=UPI0015A08C84|nr:hypothetical protein [Pantoea sp. B9002]NWA63447.1 hypothetical protein [Pantoea sp. B9002]